MYRGGWSILLSARPYAMLVLGLLVGACGYRLAGRPLSGQADAPAKCYRVSALAPGNSTAVADQYTRAALAQASVQLSSQCPSAQEVVLRVVSFTNTERTLGYDARLTALQSQYELQVQWQIGDIEGLRETVTSRRSAAHSTDSVRDEQIGLDTWRLLAEDNVRQLALRLRRREAEFYAHPAT